MSDPQLMLSPHFYRTEFTRSRTARKHGIVNEPSADQWFYLAGLAQECLEPARVALDIPIVVTSGYRCPELNEKIGGVHGSDHMILIKDNEDNAAADITCIDLGGLFRWLWVEAPWSRLIWEYDEWIHISWSHSGRLEGRKAQRKKIDTDYYPLYFEEVITLRGAA